MIFQDETMTCIMSGRTQQADPNIESGWDCYMVDGMGFYVSKEWREASYQERGEEATIRMVVMKIQELRGQ